MSFYWLNIILLKIYVVRHREPVTEGIKSFALTGTKLPEIVPVLTIVPETDIGL